MTSAEALHYAIERLNTDLSQTPHIFPLTSGQQALLLEVVSVLGDLQDAIQTSCWCGRAFHGKHEANAWR